ncbi:MULTISPECIES: stage V sporulation protein AC [Bacillus]|uniref:stage V sporulation protein AC n=1 Tax=Bacillus TaxID=1386 RepID=UPI0001A18A74|nr:stage V sporulation protein AC [Bacillus pseudomycoides]AIK40755.1 stage V sporulation protein AC [Bacillus pseudomycoides]AJI15120.1 stage V sporulation protein AC [Bacillus pseudomycoides]EEM15495.1 Stage V sporulation protein AC [Bacillus pseudomycoides DSM 12442]MED1594991.1 stage V sporulation protein AC [Bacillus pseudomycoides]MED4709699.1 stage V sporulation protein AC [Bacillus pseudomycoides]
MAQNKLKDDYINKVKNYHPKPNYVMNCVKAFVVGGLICTVGECLMKFYMYYFHFNEQNAGNPTIATLVLLSVILTGFGVYDKIGQFGGAGSAVPVTGFANSMASAAMEHRSEGIVLGVATNMFKLAGSVIVFGVVGAYIVGLIRYTFKLWLS